MSDQANRLRLMMLAGGRQLAPRASAAGAPQLIVVASGKGGVGTTTIAVNVAVALARDGRRTVLVDADLGRADATRLCRVSDAYTVADVLAGRRGVHETLTRGPAGVQVLPGAWATGNLDGEPAAQQRLLDGLTQLGPHADYIVIDAGSALDRVAGRFWQAADRVLVVTSPEATSVTNAYAAVKLLAPPGREPQIQTVVNLAPSAESAAEISRRLARACRRFLGLVVDNGCYLPLEPAVAAAGKAQTPFVLAHAGLPASEQLERLASRLTAVVAADPVRRTDSQSAASRLGDGPEVRPTGPAGQAAPPRADRGVDKNKEAGRIASTHGYLSADT